MGKHAEELLMKECKASAFANCHIVFSGLDADVAGDIGKASMAGQELLTPGFRAKFLKAGLVVFLNAKNTLIPLVVPTVNYHTLTSFPINENTMV